MSKEGDPLGQRAADFLVGLKAKLKARLFRRRLTRSELESVARPLMRVTERVLAEKESFSQLMDGPLGEGNRTARETWRTVFLPNLLALIAEERTWKRQREKCLSRALEEFEWRAVYTATDQGTASPRAWRHIVDGTADWGERPDEHLGYLLTFRWIVATLTSVFATVLANALFASAWDARQPEEFQAYETLYEERVSLDVKMRAKIIETDEVVGAFLSAFKAERVDPILEEMTDYLRAVAVDITRRKFKPKAALAKYKELMAKREAVAAELRAAG